jgi:hypothetical protein
VGDVPWSEFIHAVEAEGDADQLDAKHGDSPKPEKALGGSD